MLLTRLPASSIGAILLVWFQVLSVNAEDIEGGYDVGVHYDKAEVMIPMRDGVELFTAIYTPKQRTEQYPILLYRTPYSIGNYGSKTYPTAKAMAPSAEMVEDGYIFVYQDLRGTYKSEGNFEITRVNREPQDGPLATDESTDAYDTIDWLINNIDGHSGRVGQWGISYSGWTTVQGMIDAHPALKASSPQASPSDMFIGDDWHHNGAFRLTYAFAWLDFAAQDREAPTEEAPEPFSYGTPWGYEFFLNAGPTSEMNKRFFNGRVPAWEDFIEHPNYDRFWQRRNMLQHMNNIDHPILNVAGWFDAEDFYGPLSIYQEIEKRNPENQSTFVSGPWRHGGWMRDDGSSLGDFQFGSKTSEYFKENVVTPFFAYHLKGEGDWDADEAIVFQTGANRWRHLDEWPPKNVEYKPLFLVSNGALAFEKPAATSSSDEYVSDPKKPVPFTKDITVGWPGHTWMIEDQRFVSTRPDVLVYRSEVLKDDLTIAGPILANLFVSSTGSDADFFVKLIDEFPGDIPESSGEAASMAGQQMLVGVEVMRAKYRDNFEFPQPLEPGVVTPISFNIWDKFHTFKKGHRIMVQIHSSWFPAYDRNPQQFTDIYRALPEDYKAATQQIHRSNDAASNLVLPVLIAN